MTARIETLFITQFYRPELIGSGPFCADLAECLAAAGHPVQVLTNLPHYPGRTIFPGYGGAAVRETVGGVQVHRLPTRVPRSGGARERLLSEGHFLIQGCRALVSGKARRSPLVLSLCPSIFASLLGNLARAPGGRHITVVHDIQSGLARGLGMLGGSLPAALQRLERYVLNRTDLVVVLSEKMRQHLRAAGVTTPIEVFPIWVDVDAIHPLPANGRTSPTVIYSGNFGRKQGLDQVLDLAARLQEARPDIVILLRGQGSQTEHLAAQIAARSLTNVKVANLVPAEGLNAGLAEGDIHLVPQDPEAADFAVPSKIYNIMAAGRPFIATARPGSVLWSLQQECGGFLCVPPHDAQRFSDAVTALAEDATLRAEMGARARRFVVERFAKQRILGDLMAALDGARSTAV
jgi:putative colanic acid biosynthesis glycosyltransferase WcaI